MKILKFADDSTIVELITDGDESAFRKEIEQLATWCSHNNLLLNARKTVEMVVDFRRNPPFLPSTSVVLWFPCRVSQVPGYCYVQGPEVGKEHGLLSEKSPTKDVLPKTAEEIQSATGPHDPVLHSYHRVHPHLIDNHLV